MTTPPDLQASPRTLPNPTGLIDFFLHPPLKLCSPQLDHFGPYTGNNEIHYYSTTPFPSYTPQTVSQTAGVLVVANGPIPLEWGQDQGWVSSDGLIDTTVFVPPIGQLVVTHNFATGAAVVSQIETISMFHQLVMWTHSLPATVGLLVAPGFSFDLYFVVFGGSG